MSLAEARKLEGSLIFEAWLEHETNCKNEKPEELISIDADAYGGKHEIRCASKKHIDVCRSQNSSVSRDCRPYWSRKTNCAWNVQQLLFFFLHEKVRHDFLFSNC